VSACAAHRRRQGRATSSRARRRRLPALAPVAAAQRAADQANESLRVARARFSTGAAPQFDVLQAEVAVANAEQALVRAQTSTASALANLNAALNLPLDSALDLADTLEPRPVDGTLAAAIAQALRARPDLAAVQSQIAAAQAGVDVAASGGRPTVSLAGGYDVGNASGQANSVSGRWFVSLSVTLSVSDGGVTHARIREAQARLEQMKAREAQIKQQVELDVRQAWLALQQAAAELVASAKAVEQGREAARLAAVRYEAGVGTSLEVLSAQATLAQGELSLAPARFNQNAARNQLILATGSL
jgi:outer membrane protein TolC